MRNFGLDNRIFEILVLKVVRRLVEQGEWARIPDGVHLWCKKLRNKK